MKKIEEVRPWKIEVSANDVESCLPAVYEQFPFLRDWHSVWYSMGVSLVFYDTVPNGVCYLINKNSTGSFEVFMAREEGHGYLVSIKPKIPLFVF